MDIAVVGTSRKEHEKRVAIHPQQIAAIRPEIRKHLFFERGYGTPFGMDDEVIARLTGNALPERKALFHDFKAVIIPKPVEEDFRQMQQGTCVWGWIHAVQQKSVTQIAIEKKLTFIAWENMYDHTARNRIHVFERNNEMAGYCGIQHALQIRGIDGNYGIPRKIAVLGFGSVSRGAILALLGHGFHNITVYTQRPSHLVSNKFPGVLYKRMLRDQSGCFTVAATGKDDRPLIDELTDADIIVNGVLQDPLRPIVFIGDEDIMKFKKECLIIDVSCDKAMGFSFAHPTDFSHPFYKIGNILYYSIDHTPSILWNSASFEISSSLMPYIDSFVNQREHPVLDNATDIRDGVILNKEILAFQNRSPIYPYKPLEPTQQEESIS